MFRQKNIYRNTVLHTAAMDGEFEKVLHLKNHVKFQQMLIMPDYNGNLPLDRAAPRGHYLIVKMLLELHTSLKLPYTMYNSQNYTPLLASIRWYCKVLDGTYAEGNVYGKFNIGSNKSRDYLHIIKLLIKHFPEHIHQVDKKNLYALHYVIFHLSTAFTDPKENAGLIQSYIQLIKVLLENGMSLDQTTESRSSPRAIAKDKKILHLIENIEDVIKSEKEKIVNTVPEKNVSTIPKKLPIYTSEDLPLPIFSKPKTQLSEDETVYSNFSRGNGPEKINENVTQIKPAEECLPKINISKLIKKICKKFEKNSEYQSNLITRLNYNTIKNQFQTLLVPQSDSIVLLNEQERNQFVTALSQAMHFNSLTTGFLCWKDTTYWISLDQNCVQCALEKIKQSTKAAPSLCVTN